MRTMEPRGNPLQSCVTTNDNNAGATPRPAFAGLCRPEDKMDNIEITGTDGQQYITGDHGYIGLRVAPGSDLDNTSKKIGICWKYPQYDRGPIVDAMREHALPLIRAEEQRREEAARARATRTRERPGLCPHCHTYCCGDCGA